MRVPAGSTGTARGPYNQERSLIVAVSLVLTSPIPLLVELGQKCKSDVYAGGGMNRHITSHDPTSFCRMHACMRPSSDLRTGKPIGTVAVPCLVVTTNWRIPSPAGIDHVTLSTGAQSL